MSFWIGFVRANYLAIAVVGTLPALPFGYGLFAGLFQSRVLRGAALLENAVTLAVVCALLVPAIRALRRRMVSGAVIPAELIRERPVVTKVVTFAGIFGHVFTAIVVSVVVDIAVAPEIPDDVGGPIAFCCGIALFCYLIALLCGELALVGDGVSDTARN